MQYEGLLWMWFRIIIVEYCACEWGVGDGGASQQGGRVEGGSRKRRLSGGWGGGGWRRRLAHRPIAALVAIAK